MATRWRDHLYRNFANCRYAGESAMMRILGIEPDSQKAELRAVIIPSMWIQ